MTTKLYLVTDVEGVSGVDSFDTYGDRTPGEVAKKRLVMELWTREVNAAIEGAYATGCNKIVVLDNHGSGANLSREKIIAPAELIHGRYRNTWLPLLDSSYDAVICIGQHAMAGAPGGHLAHTYSRSHLERVVLNGSEIGEFGIIAGIAGSFGVPAVFISGDEAAVQEAKTVVPNIGSVVTKRGLTMLSCVSRPVGIVCDEIRESVRATVASCGKIEPVVWDSPFELTVDYRLSAFWRATLRGLLRRTSGSLIGLRRVRLRDDNLQQVWDRFIGFPRGG